MCFFKKKPEIVSHGSERRGDVRYRYFSDLEDGTLHCQYEQNGVDNEVVAPPRTKLAIFRRANTGNGDPWKQLKD